MALQSIQLDALPASPEQARKWCAQLEEGDILYFSQTPVPIPAADLDFLLNQRQSGGSIHKNIAYKPDRNRLSGCDGKTMSAAEVDRLRDIMRRYSASVAAFLHGFLAPYQGRWRLDYASYRPIEEEGRDLPLRRRNDLLHTDAFPTRPTRGARILRFFHNVHPTRTRDWVVGEPFRRLVSQFAPGKLALPRSRSGFGHAASRMAQTTGLARLVPQWKRTPYDEFMMRLHNAMKEDAGFQNTCAKVSVQFAPGSSWIVYTETVPHAVLGGQYALEQTFFVDPAAMVVPDSAPVALLEKLAAATLT